MSIQINAHGSGFIEKSTNPVEIILDFIIDTFPIKEYPRILEIAAGDGNLSQLLSNCGYQVTAMDPKINCKKNINYNVLSMFFHEHTDISAYDLGIAIHPCGIHKDIIKNFMINEKVLFLIPCCTFSCDNKELMPYRNNQNWLNYLEALNPKMKKKVFFGKNNSGLLVNSFSNAFYTK